ncbi:MAG: hypothetical protein NVSMB9_36580 [Isosphaeraceae bacterium]
MIVRQARLISRAVSGGLVALALSVRAEEPPNGLSLADLGPYRAALDGASASVPAIPVTFRALWEHPEHYQGRRVRVEGRVARRFRQGSFGTFPSLCESWILSTAGDPFCLVFPIARKTDDVTTHTEDAVSGTLVRFEGTYLKRLRYQGGDAPRLVPLIVGERPPVVTRRSLSGSQGESPGFLDSGAPGAGWMLGLVAAGFVALVVVRQHVGWTSARWSRRAHETGPDPLFLDDPDE